MLIYILFFHILLSTEINKKIQEVNHLKNLMLNTSKKNIQIRLEIEAVEDYKQ